MPQKQLIGRTDIVDFPDLKLFNIAVKIDTGAYTSAIHCASIIEQESQLICTFYSKGHPNFNGIKSVFDTFTLTDIKSSNGFKENRYKIKTTVTLFNTTYPINLTLTTRDDMKFPVLLGRQFLSKKFIVDVDVTNQSYKQILL